MRVDRKPWAKSWLPFLWHRWCYAMYDTEPNVCFLAYSDHKFSWKRPENGDKP
jgi:hypothetical protein